jgi:nicotinate phosphoribosyltransferase
MTGTPGSALPAYEAGSLSLLTDLYQLTMGYAYWKEGMAEREAVFHLSFRKQPFGGGYAVAAGLGLLVEYLRGLRFTDQDCESLAALEDPAGGPLFEPAFIDYLRGFRFDCDVDAIPEGTVVFAHQPLVRVRGPIFAAQLIETPALNLVNFSTLIATKAARVVLAAGGDPVVDGGLRRAQGIDGSITAARSAFVGGVAATSNVLAGRIHGIPVRGTHAHSWVMAHAGELEAFRSYAAAMPRNCVFLVDTYDTLEGVRNAIRAGTELRARGHRLIGIRLDSGDLAYLSAEARRMLDQAGFEDARIYASNDLDEHIIASLKAQGARVHTWLVGTQLLTGGKQPALGGVYKLGAMRGEDGRWIPKLKRSEQSAKMSFPGMLQVRRFEDADGRYVGDMTWDELDPPDPGEPTLIDPEDPVRRHRVAPGTASRELLVPVFRRGEPVAPLPTLRQSSELRERELARLHPAILRLENPHRYPAGIAETLHRRRTEMALQEWSPGADGRDDARAGAPGDPTPEPGRSG